MTELTRETFHAWLERYSSASRENDPRASAELFSRNARYYETPFDRPMVGREAIRKYWEVGARTLRDRECCHEILAVQGNRGVARWQSKFTEKLSDRRLELDCLFVVEFDDQGLCCLFREWWHLRVLNAGAE